MLHEWDEERLSAEMRRYHEMLDESCEREYQLAETARNLGKDIIDTVEIPRASDLADRTEKLLAEYLDGLTFADDLRKMLKKEDRETTSIQMSKQVAKRMYARTGDLVKAIDTGLRVGLAIITEAVLVAPLEGISNVRLLNNADGSQFVSVDFCGPIRAAGGTAQALAVLITDVVRKELGVGRYIARREEIERVKEEFGLYRGNLQYRPSPEDIEKIVKACPVMVNGESTESEECAGYGNIENVDGSRVRGGVLLVIGEGLCLKAPKIKKYTEGLKVEGWDFISEFADDEKKEDGIEKSSFKKKQLTANDRFMQDIIAGRPVFGEPLAAGGFRLRYGRTRATGLAAGSLSPVTMSAMGEFIAVGTQLKIERPGKACAVTPSDALQGPTVLMRDGTFGRIDLISRWQQVKQEADYIWDNGEIMLGYGEFLENNKNLVPSAYNRDWWAADMLAALDTEKSINILAKILGTEVENLPNGIPSNGDGQGLKGLREQKEWTDFLTTAPLDWRSARAICEEFNTAVPPPFNLNWLDLPMEWMTTLHRFILQSHTTPASECEEEKWNLDHSSTEWLVIPGAVSGWRPLKLGSPPAEQPAGPELEAPEMLGGERSEDQHHLHHGIIKTAVMLLGLPHHHSGDDIVLTNGWEALIEGLGLTLDNGEVRERVAIHQHLSERLERLRNAIDVISREESRLSELEAEREVVRREAETAARQRGEDITSTDAAGAEAAAMVPDPGPDDAERLLAARRLVDEEATIGSLHVVRNCSSLRWEHNAPVRIGARMARPEKAAHRLMKTSVNALFPVGTEGGPQRLLTVASSKGNLRVTMGSRECLKCGRPSPFPTCHHRLIKGDATSTCGGSTKPTATDSKSRRQGELQSLPLKNILQSIMEDLGIDRLPKIKGVKGLSSKSQTPEPLEKGILRAVHNLPVFRDGTVRFDMSDIPLTHFRPCEIGTSWQRLVELGYDRDIWGDALTSDDQILELFPQDFVASTKAIQHLINTCRYIDDLLVRFYGMDAHYNVSDVNGLIGQMTIALAPHTSGGVLSRLIGFTGASGGYAHTLFHAAKRRNCDGDEDCIMLLLDGLLNFSREILPANRGGQMDAPLVLTTRLNPAELDKEALNVDSAWFYPRSFYEATLSSPHPGNVSENMDFVQRRLGTIGAARGYGFTHDLSSLDAGPENSAYKILETMVDKMNAQIALAAKLRAVNVEKVASSVVESHFFPDLRGNLLAFTRQRVRCGRCGEKYRRIPLSGKCIKQHRAPPGAAAITRTSSGMQCGGNLIMTVSEGAVRKYVKVARHVMDTYGTSDYTKQKFDVLADSLDSLFKNDRIKVFTLDDFV